MGGINNFKNKIVSFVIHSVTEMTYYSKFEVNVLKWVGRKPCFLSCSRGYINETQAENMIVYGKNIINISNGKLASLMNLFLTSVWIYSDSYENKKMSARRGAQFVPIGMPIILLWTLKNSLSKFIKYVVNKKLQLTDQLFLCVACFTRFYIVSYRIRK